VFMPRWTTSESSRKIESRERALTRLRIASSSYARRMVHRRVVIIRHQMRAAAYGSDIVSDTVYVHEIWTRSSGRWKTAGRPRRACSRSRACTPSYCAHMLTDGLHGPSADDEAEHRSVVTLVERIMRRRCRGEVYTTRSSRSRGIRDSRRDDKAAPACLAQAGGLYGHQFRTKRSLT